MSFDMTTSHRLHGPDRLALLLVYSTRRTRAFDFPADFDAVVSEFDLRDGEDCFVDELYAAGHRARHPVARGAAIRAPTSTRIAITATSTSH